MRGSYSEGFRAPSFDELYYPNFGNPNLRPEISSEYDGGVTKQLGEAGTVGVVYFNRRIHDLIVAVPCTVGPNCEFGSKAGNAGRVDTQGVEFIPALTPWHGLGLSGNFTYLDETHSSPPTGGVPVRVPKYSASATLHYARTELIRAGDGLSADLVYIFVGDRDDISPMGTILDNAAYQRFDLTVNYSPALRWGRIQHQTDLRARSEHARPQLSVRAGLQVAAGQLCRRRGIGVLDPTENLSPPALRIWSAARAGRFRHFLTVSRATDDA